MREIAIYLSGFFAGIVITVAAIFGGDGSSAKRKSDTDDERTLP